MPPSSRRSWGHWAEQCTVLVWYLRDDCEYVLRDSRVAQARPPGQESQHHWPGRNPGLHYQGSVLQMTALDAASVWGLGIHVATHMSIPDAHIFKLELAAVCGEITTDIFIFHKTFLVKISFLVWLSY